MDARLLRYYNQELRYLRELGGDFAREFPKIASRLHTRGQKGTAFEQALDIGVGDFQAFHAQP